MGFFSQLLVYITTIHKDLTLARYFSQRSGVTDFPSFLSSLTWSSTRGLGTRKKIENLQTKKSIKHEFQTGLWGQVKWSSTKWQFTDDVFSSISNSSGFYWSSAASAASLIFITNVNKCISVFENRIQDILKGIYFKDPSTIYDPIVTPFILRQTYSRLFPRRWLI